MRRLTSAERGAYDGESGCVFSRQGGRRLVVGLGFWRKVCSSRIVFLALHDAGGSGLRWWMVEWARITSGYNFWCPRTTGSPSGLAEASNSLALFVVDGQAPLCLLRKRTQRHHHHLRLITEVTGTHLLIRRVLIGFLVGSMVS